MIIAIEAGDAKDAVSQFAQSYNLNFQVWLDPDGSSLKAFGNGSLPNSYVIDRLGIVRYAWTGEINLAMLEKYVTPLIAEQLTNFFKLKPSKQLLDVNLLCCKDRTS